MENLHTCSLTESDLIPQRDTEGVELFEDASSNADWIDMYSDIESHTTGGLLEDYNRPMDLLDDLYEKNKILERKWEDAEKKYQHLLRENVKQNLNLSNEKERANRYQKKLQYIQSNCALLNRFKEDYRDSMCNPNNSIKVSQECSAQTDVAELFVNDSQRNNDKLQKFEKFCTFAKNENIVAVKRSELQLMKSTLDQLKVMVDQKSSRNDQDEHKAELHKLQNTIAILNDTIAKKNYEINSLKLVLGDGKKIDAIEKENTAMKRIIIKLEKKHREIEKLCKPFSNIPILTEDEKTIVQSIFKRCGSPVKKCSRSLSYDAANSTLNSNRREVESSQLSNKNCNPFITVICQDDMLYFNIPNGDSRTKCTHIENPEKPFTPKSQFIKTLS